MTVDRKDLILSAYQGTNDVVFKNILKLHASEGWKIADVTYGKGTFWKQVDTTKYDLLATDIKTGVDCRKLPYGNGEIDCVVFDPPYMEGFYRKTKSHLAMAGRYGDFRQRYSDGKENNEKQYHAGVVQMYYDTGLESRRVLRNNGVFIVKCQDEVSNHKQHLTHVEIINQYLEYGFYCKDLFVVMRRDTPSCSRIKHQEHARKNHSYFLIFIKQPQ